MISKGDDKVARDLLDAVLLRDLLDERIALSMVIMRIAQRSSICQNPLLKKSLLF
jgi:hypothetical protein